MSFKEFMQILNDEGLTKRLQCYQIPEFVQQYLMYKHTEITELYIHKDVNISVIRFGNGKSFVFHELNFGYSGGGPDATAEVLRLAGYQNHEDAENESDKSTLIWHAGHEIELC